MSKKERHCISYLSSERLLWVSWTVLLLVDYCPKRQRCSDRGQDPTSSLGLLLDASFFALTVCFYQFEEAVDCAHSTPFVVSH